MKLSEKIMNKMEAISVIGLGYAGMPMAVAFAKKVNVIGFDIFTDDEAKLDDAMFHIVTVPTSFKPDRTIDLSPVEEASRMVGRHLRQGAIVVYESAVYPGVTEKIYIPILEQESGMICGRDFKVGYSPERVNPGYRVYRFENMKKIISGIDHEALDEIAAIYELIIEAGVHKASCIMVAEAAKAVENSQRDINIAFMNELSMMFEQMQIDTHEVIEALVTKWNALSFYPGLAGGPCIGFDPYYFVYESERLGYHSQMVLAGRKINYDMVNFIVDMIIKQLVLTNKHVKHARVAIFGITLYENCSDISNSKVVDMIKRLKEYGLEPMIVDPYADEIQVRNISGINLTDMDTIKDVDCCVFSVAHDRFKQLSIEQVSHYFITCDNNEKVIIDLMGIFNKNELLSQGYRYWRL